MHEQHGIRLSGAVMNREYTSLIQRMETICPIPEIDKQQHLSIVQLKKVSKGDFFVRAGDTVRLLAFMVSGLLSYYYVSVSGKEYIKHFCFGDNFVATLPALLGKKPSEYSIKAIEDTVLIVFGYEEWQTLLEKSTVLSGIHIQFLNQAVVYAEKRERSLIIDDAQRRYIELLEEFPGIEERVRLYDIAIYLGITPVALSRIRGKPVKKMNFC
jgi:CRP-like cAMP-binding protein